MKDAELKRLIEAALFISSRPLTVEEIARAIGSGNLSRIKGVVSELENEYNTRNSGIMIRVNNDRRTCFMHVSADLEEKIMHLAPEKEMSDAMLKTLAFIAYSQPVSQSEVVGMRGNRAYHYIKRLHEMGFIQSKRQGRTKLLTLAQKFYDYFQVEKDALGGYRKFGK